MSNEDANANTISTFTKFKGSRVASIKGLPRWLNSLELWSGYSQSVCSLLEKKRMLLKGGKEFGISSGILKKLRKI